jgi:chromate reductase, NAD(P)H dehydrogenase (quinone)
VKATPIRIVALSGSLRKASSNSALLRVAASLAPRYIHIALFDGIGDLPHFTPDLEENAPAEVADFRAQIGAADGVMIASPEYAHGVPGAMKNALDWLVGGSEIVNKPVALLNAAPRATHAYAALGEILTVMNARLIDGACITLPQAIHKLDEPAIADCTAVTTALHGAITALTAAIDAGRNQTD